MRQLLHTIDCNYLGDHFAAAYLRVAGDEAAFVETNTTHAVPRLLAALEQHGVAREAVRWIVVTHVHLDHAGGAGALAATCPNATVLAHPRAARHLRDPSKLVASAEQVYGAARFAELYGAIPAIAAERVRELGDGESVPFGSGELRVHHTRGHAKHHFVVEDRAIDAVFTGDTFGLVYPALQRAGLFAFPSTSPTDFEADEARRSIDKVLALACSRALLTHFGEVHDQAGVATQLRAWLEVSEALVEHARGKGPEVVDDLRASLHRTMAERAAAVGLTLDDDDWKMLALDLDLNAQGLYAAAQRPA